MSESSYNVDNPYYVEYARSGRAKCRGCFNAIYESDPRIAELVQSYWNSGKMPQWYHFDCFFEEHHPKSTQEIANYKNMRRWERVEIKQQIALNHLPGEYEEEESDGEYDSDEDYLSDEEDEDVVEATSTKKKKT